MKPKTELFVRKLPGRIKDGFPSPGAYTMAVAVGVSVIAAIARLAIGPMMLGFMDGWTMVPAIKVLVALVLLYIVFMFLILLSLPISSSLSEANGCRIEELERELEGVDGPNEE